MIAAWNGWPGRALRVALAVLPLVWLGRTVRWADVGHAATAAGPAGLLLAFSALFAAAALATLRWRVLLASYGAHPARLPAIPTLLRHYLVGLYFGMLPTGVAGDVVRAHRVESCFERPATAYLIVVVERLAGLVGLLLLAGATSVWAPLPASPALAVATDVALAIGLVLAAVMFAIPQAARAWPGVQRTVRRVPVIGTPLAAVPPANDLRGPLAAVLLSVGTNACTALGAAPLLYRGDLATTAEACLRAMPAVLLVTFIPITPAALGQREVAFTHFFGLAGIPAADALAASLVTFGLTVALALSGGVMLLLERARSR